MKTQPFSTITIYHPNQRHEFGFFQTWSVMTRNVIRSRELIWQLFKRDFFAGFKKSFLGKGWLFISPLLGIVSWVFYQQIGMLHPGEVGIPYPAYVLIGSSMWGLFIGMFTAASGTLSSGSDLIMQVKYPHEALLFKQVAQQLADFSIGFIMCLLLLFAFGVTPSWKIIFFPVVALPLFFLSSGLGLIVSMISVVAMDIKKGVDLVIGLLIIITPVIYSNRIDHALGDLLLLIAEGREREGQGLVDFPVKEVAHDGFHALSLLRHMPSFCERVDDFSLTNFSQAHKEERKLDGSGPSP